MSSSSLQEPDIQVVHRYTSRQNTIHKIKSNKHNIKDSAYISKEEEEEGKEKRKKGRRRSRSENKNETKK